MTQRSFETPAVVTPIDATLNRLRMRGDPLADAVAPCLDIASRNTAASELRFLARCEIGAYQELLDYSDSLPQQADLALLEQARKVQLAFAPQRHLAWLYGALPQGSGTSPLLHPNQLATEWQQRLQWHHCINQALAQPNSLLPGGKLHELLLEQRLYWAWQRKLARDQNWNTLEFGEPFNQEYLLLVLLEYSQLTLANMARLGARLQPADQAAVQHFWWLAGHWLGLDANLNPARPMDASPLLQRIRWRYSSYTLRRRLQQQHFEGWLETNSPRHLSAPMQKALLQWCNPPASQSPAVRPDPGLQWLLAANRGATLAHYHLPGVCRLRCSLHQRGYHQDDDSAIQGKHYNQTA